MMLSVKFSDSDRDRDRQIYSFVLEQALKDIASNIEINNNFTIKHPQYSSIELPHEIKKGFLGVPDFVKNNYLQIKLQSFIFHNYYNEPQLLFLSEPTSINKSLSSTINIREEDRKIENNTFKWSKTKFYRDLCHFNQSQGYFESGWLVTGRNKEGLLKVCKDELTLHIDPQRYLDTTEQIAKIGELVSVKMPPHYVEPGYYIAVSNLGSINKIDLEDKKTVVDIYFNLNSEGTLKILDKITRQLNQLKLLFNFKTLYYSEDYLISDAASLSFLRQDYNLVMPVIKSIYQTNASYFQPEIPLFAKYLAPGLSLAERPISSDGKLEHFGINRCRIIAIALIKAWQSNITSAKQKLQYIIDAFSNARIDLEQPYLNAGSEDIYD